jgi:hypothetical protein
MNKLLTFVVVLLLAVQGATAQKPTLRPAAVGISFFFNDFTTPNRIRTSSLSTVIRDDKWAKFSEMSPGLAISYFKGVLPYIDFAGSIAFSFPEISLPAKANNSGSSLLMEADASFNFKLLSEDYWFTPYAIAGVGGSKYKSYYGAFIPLGLGVKVNFYDEAALFIASQYRVPVTGETNNYHMMTSFGVAGVIGNNKKAEPAQVTY